jgi:hypothetical protein
MGQAATASAVSPAPVQKPDARPAVPEGAARFPLPPSLYSLARLCTGAAHPEQFSESCWPALIRLALEHGVAPLFYLQTRRLPLPEAAAAELKKIYRSNLARNLMLDQERVALQAELLQRAGPVIPLKGPPLATLLYGDPGARQVADLDLLIRPEHLRAADRVLTGRGFTREAAPLEQLQGCRDVCYARSAQGDGEFCVDLHLRLRPYGSGDALLARLWQEGLTPENLLLYLCLNWMVHRWARLQPLLDIVAFLRQPRNLNAERLVATARELEWTAGAGHCLRFAAQLAGMAAPCREAEQLSGSRAQRWCAERLLGRDVEQLLERSRALDGPLGTLALLACENGIGGRLRLAGAILFPPRASLRQMDAAGASLPLPLHYAQRAARKASQAMKALAAARRAG